MKVIRACSSLPNQRGFTLVETIFSIMVAAVVLVGVVEAFLYLTSMSGVSKNRTLVFQDVQTTMERISGLSLNDLNTEFPDGQVLLNTFVSNVLGGYKLPSETITVTYPSGTNTNPREIVVVGQWVDRGIARIVTLRTYKRG